MIDQVTDNKPQCRYELNTGKGIAVAAYTLNGGIMTFTHTIVPESLRGHGLASRLIAAALADARQQGLRISAQCPFVAAYLERHPAQ